MHKTKKRKLQSGLYNMISFLKIKEWKERERKTVCVCMCVLEGQEGSVEESVRIAFGYIAGRNIEGRFA